MTFPCAWCALSNPATSVCITESLAGVGARVDREAGIIYGVKLIGLESANGRSYPGPVLRSAVQHYESLAVNLDHPGKATDPRTVADRWGRVVNPRHVEGQGNFGDIKYNKAHPQTESILWFAENDPGALGFSHNATLKLKPGVGGNGKRTVESIQGVRSLDLVADPATTKGFFESQDPDSLEEDAMDLKSLTLEQLKEARPDLVTALESQQAESSELESLKAKIEALETEKAALALEQTIAGELEAAQLTKEQCSDVFLEQLKSAKDAAARKALIEDRKALVAAQEQRKPGDQKPVTTKAKDGATPALESLDDVRKFLTSRA